MTVDGIDYYVTEKFGKGLYDSCKDVKFGTMNTRAIDFVGGGAKSFEGNISCFEIIIINCVLYMLMRLLSI